MKFSWGNGRLPVTGRSVSNETKKKIASSLRGAKHFAWKEVASYGSIHDWIRNNYGKAVHCENELCQSGSQQFDWALRKGFIYKKKVENFIQLCRSCHINYDNKGERIVPQHQTRILKDYSRVS
jgi:hypothetical protein